MRTVDRIDRAELYALQEAKLANLGERLRNNPFYGPRIAEVGGRLDHARLSDVEPVLKEDLLQDQERTPPYGRRLGVGPNEVAMVHTTAGTSGRGKEIHALTWRDVEAAGHLSSFAFRWAGLGFGEPAAFHVGFSNSSGGNAMLRGVQAIGHTPVMVGHLGFGERLELLREFPPVGMYATPSAINGLAMVAADEGWDLAEVFPDLQFLLTSAEPYPVEWAERMQETWGAVLYEDYGATQSASSICASCCEQGAIVDGGRGRMHLFEWSFLFEIVDPDTLEPTPAGEFGELLITSLDKEASPVVRFRTQDRVRYLGHDGCGCGRAVMAIECGTITRYDDMMKIKGQNVWPADMETLVFSQPGIREFQGRVVIGGKGRDELLLDVAIQEGMAPEDLPERLARHFKSKVNITPKVRVVSLEELPQWDTPELKARRFVDERQEGLGQGSEG